MKLIIKVVEIKGNCPVYRVGDKIVLDEGYKLNLSQTDALCMHSLGSIMPYYNAIYKGLDPAEFGLARKGEGGKGKSAYVQCLDPHLVTGGGTVTFEIRRESKGGKS